jgi:hypothetical protein
MSARTTNVFGNPDITMDALPLRILSDLRVRFPDIAFITLDPNEEWEIPDPFIIIDTVVGLTALHHFESLDEFDTSPTVSMHDFDALFNLRYLAKLGKLKRIHIIGIPPDWDEGAAIEATSAAIRALAHPSVEAAASQTSSI